MKKARSRMLAVLPVLAILFLFAPMVVSVASAQSHAAAGDRSMDRPGNSQPAAAPGQMSPEDMQKMMALIAPGEHHKAMARFVGDWKTTMKMWMEPGEPTVASGKSSFELILGGRYLRSKQTGTFADMPFEGMGIDGYDNAQKQYVSVWVDNMGTGVMTLTGQPSADGKGIDYSGTTFDPQQMKAIRVREEIRWPSDTTYTFTMYMEMPGPGGKPTLVKSMELTGVKM